MPSWLEESAFSGSTSSSFKPPRKNFASTDSRKVIGIVFSVKYLTQGLFSGSFGFQSGCPSSLSSVYREDLSKTTVCRARRLFSLLPMMMMKNGNRRTAQPHSNDLSYFLFSGVQLLVVLSQCFCWNIKKVSCQTKFKMLSEMVNGETSFFVFV